MSKNSRCEPTRPRRIAGVLATVACAVGWFSSPASAQSAAPEVITLKLAHANVHLIRAAQPVLIDAGSPQDWAALQTQLAAVQLKPCDIRWVVVTHAHQDHGGLARDLQQRCGAAIAMHQADVPMAAVGGHDPALRYTRWMSRLVWWWVNYRYPAFTPDVVWTMAAGESQDLQAMGLRGRVVSAPGHTSGAIAVVLDDGRAFIGDMVAGGSLGGVIHADQTSEHYFHGDAAQNYRSLRTLINSGAHTFYLGHGGPLTRANLLQALPALEAQPHDHPLIHPTKDQP